MPPPDPLSRTDLVAALPRLRRYARVLTGDLLRADDLVLETLESARGRRETLSPSSSLRTGLFTLMHCLHRDGASPPRDAWGRRASRHFDDPADSPENPRGTVHSGHPDADDLLNRMMRMPLDEREVLVLVAVEGLSYAEIAALLGVPNGTVMATLARARETMRHLAPKPSPEGPPLR
jgi:RNA polymerase sigma-70 factor (ECF subfamily)